MSRTLEEAQADPDLRRRPSHLQRYAGPGAPMRSIVGVGGNDAFGTAVLLGCGHWRVIRDWNIMPAMGKKRPAAAKCGCCRDGIKPDPRWLAQAKKRQEAA